MATNLRPFRDYDEHDVVNLFAFSGSYPQTKGNIVTIMGNGWKNSDEPFDMAGAPGAGYSNTVSQRYGLNAYVRQCASGETPLGMTLYDVRETDENGEKLIYNPRKAVEMGCVISGQAVPVLTRGTVLYSGTTLAALTVAAGDSLYATDNGELTNSHDSTWTHVKVGKALGAKDDSNHVLIRLEL
jgi:hypothetical protein